jgi:small subunit ribosomal protein S30e
VDDDDLGFRSAIVGRGARRAARDATFDRAPQRCAIWTRTDRSARVRIRARQVRGQTPKVAKQEKKKQPKGRAFQRIKYNRRFVNVVVGIGKKRSPNSNQA